MAGMRVLWFERDGNRFLPPQHWSRDAAALTKLPADEQKEWQALWVRVPELSSVVPTSQEKGRRWHYTIQQPPELGLAHSTVASMRSARSRIVRIP